jgi:hypothetical protein
MAQSPTEIRNTERGAVALVITVMLLVFLAALTLAVYSIRP